MPLYNVTHTHMLILEIVCFKWVIIPIFSAQECAMRKPVQCGLLAKSLELDLGLNLRLSVF